MVAGDAVFPAAATKTPKSMNQYFFAKVSFLRQQNDGTIKKESEQYLVDAMSFTETEARVIKEMGESVRELYFDSIAQPDHGSRYLRRYRPVVQVQGGVQGC